MTWLWLLSVGGWLTVVLAAALLRGRVFTIRCAILLSIYSPLAMAMMPLLARLGPRSLPVWVALHVVVYVNEVMLTRPRMRPLAYRLLVSWPAAFFCAGTFLALPWGIARGLGFDPWGPWIPYALAALGLFQSLTTRREDVDVVVGGPGHDVRVVPHARGNAREEHPLRIVQITDPHLGPFMSVARLRRIAARAVARNPDLVLLTGDFLTMESQSDPALLSRALEPLRAMPGKVFACLGNHDHEALENVKTALAETGVTLLVDEARDVETAAGPLQLVGMDFTWREREAHLARVCAANPRRPGALRIVLLHDPGAFRHLPESEADLVLSGHTHGGQVGLVSLGLAWTFLRLFGIRIPDHGFWSRGRDRMYVHRGTGHYGFPLRLGVPAEEGMLRVHRAT